MAAVFVVMNIIAAFHAYRFTHFSGTGERTPDPKELSFLDKLQTLAFGIKHPRPVHRRLPNVPFETVRIDARISLEGWWIEHPNAIGTAILFHGYSGEKSSLLERAKVFSSMGYRTLLIDFGGSGGSEGNQTTIGFYEAEQVAEVVAYVRSRGEANILVFGTSMGAAAVMKAAADRSIDVEHLVLECPFATMLSTVQARFKLMNVPPFPMAHLLVFWGGLENRFNAFSHNPVDYASLIHTPTLLIYGSEDDKVSLSDTEHVFGNLSGDKSLKVIAGAGHEDFLDHHREEWIEAVTHFVLKH